MNILEVTTNVGCVNRCQVCPQDLIASKYSGPKQLAMEDFVFCLKTIPHDVEIGFCGFSEPFLNPYCCRMIKVASLTGFTTRLLTTLVGMQKSELPQLQGANLHYIRFHMPDTVHFKFDEDHWIQLHKDFYSAKLPADYDYMTMGPISPKIRAYLDSIGIGRIMEPKMNSRAGNLWEEKKRTGNIWCKDYRWHYNVLIPNGDVVLCCMDWALQHKLGNLLTQPYMDIYREAERLRVKDHSDMLCAACSLGVPGHWYNPFGRPEIK